MAKETTLYIEWPKDRLEEAMNAPILVRFACPKLESGPVFCLALEISPSRILPRYCYYPFDLTRSAHRKALETIFEKGLLRCIFAGASKVQDRIVPIPSPHVPKMLALYKEALERLEELKPIGYDFGKALAELEAIDRVPDYFARIVSENELGDRIETIREDAEEVPPEKRELARQFFEGLFEVLRTRYPGEVRSIFDNLEAYRGFVQIVSDLYRDHGEDYQVTVHVLGDLAAITSEKEELENLSPLPRALDSFCDLLERVRSSPKADRIEIFHRLAAVLEEIRSHLASGAGLSQKVLLGAFALLGPRIRAKPGRRPQDYSHEYDSKASGLSWAEVAKQALKSRPELREEFGNRTYEDLELRQQLALRQRIRIGVDSYARRMKKPLPPRSVTPTETGGEVNVC